MASAREEIESFGAVLGRRLQAALSPKQGAAPARQEIAEVKPAASEPVAEESSAFQTDQGAARPASEAAPALEPPAPPASEAAAPVEGERYQRLRALTEAAAKSGARLWGGLEDTSTAVLPLDFSKTFVGANATHYDERWRLMEWRGRNHDWNWAAALTLGGWLAYRRLYGYALLHCVWLGLLMLLAVNGVSLVLLASLQVALALILGLYGNALYRRRFRSAATRAGLEEGGHGARLALLARAGGVNTRAPWIMGGCMAVLAALIVRFGHRVGEIPLPL